LERLACFADPTNDLVLNIRDIHDVPDGIPPELEMPSKKVDLDKSAEIADVTEVVNGGATAIEGHLGTAGRIHPGVGFKSFQLP